MISERYKYTTFIDVNTIISKDRFKFVDVMKAKKEDPMDVFVTFEFKNARLYGYLKRNEVVNEAFKKVIQERISNQNIHVIEWDDRFHVVFNDGIYISAYSYFADKESVFKLIDDLKGDVAVGN